MTEVDGMVSRPEVRVMADVPFETADHTNPSRDLRWDIYRLPVCDIPAPAALIFHGGGWRSGSRKNMTEVSHTFARHGFIAIAAEYRLVDEAAWPAALEDVKSAIRAVRLRSGDLHIDPSRLFLIGFSAGAHLALLAARIQQTAHHLAAQDLEQVAGIAAFFPPVYIDERFSAMMGLDPLIGATLSPLIKAALLPPTIVFCGDEDTVTPPVGSVELYRAIRQAGGVADLHLYSNLDHEFAVLPGMLENTVRDAVNFFTRTVLRKNEFDGALAALKHRWTPSPP